MIQYINIKEMRQHFGKVRMGLSEGITYILIYHSKPIAEIKPLQTSQNKENPLAKLFANPPKHMRIKSKKSAVELVRAERD